MSNQPTLFDGVDASRISMKRCYCCKETKPLSDFYVREKSGKKRYSSPCKSCNAKKGVEWQHKNPEKRKKILKKYNTTEKRRETSRRYSQPRADIILRATRKRRLLKYGLSGEDYDKLVAKQGGLCASCGKPETRKHPSGRVNSLAIDHDHVTGKARGLLCHACNIALGWLKEDPEMIKGLLKYLKKWKPELGEAPAEVKG